MVTDGEPAAKRIKMYEPVSRDLPVLSSRNPSSSTETSSSPSTSSLSSDSRGESSSEESEAEDLADVAEASDDEDSVRPLRTGSITTQAPSLHLRNVTSEGLSQRLEAFLPRLKAANEMIEQQRAAGTFRAFDEVEDGEAHIEMNLGLGVLEQQADDHSTSSSESETEPGLKTVEPTDTTRRKRKALIEEVVEAG